MMNASYTSGFSSNTEQVPHRFAVVPASGPGNPRDGLTVLSWWQRDPDSRTDLVVIAAIRDRRELREGQRRLGLPAVGSPERVGSRARGFAEALASPGRLLWMTLDHYAARSDQWLQEEQLEVLRQMHRWPRR